MSVMLETSLGELVIDLEVDRCPKMCENFLKLCKIKYYTLNAFFNVSKDFIAQTGDPTATGTGGSSLAHHLSQLSPSPNNPSPPRYFPPEITTKLKHTARGTVSMAVSPTQPPGCGSQFFITLSDNIEYLDGKHAVFGHVIEGLETLDKINEAYLDKEGRPLQDIRIRHVEILEDPFPDPPNLPTPESPIRPPDALPNTVRISDSEDPLAPLDASTSESLSRKTAAASSALTLEMIGDIPFATIRPPENILFVCKLNPVTADEDLELIFSRFGKVLSCEVVRDRRTGDSLQYAFIEFDVQGSAEQAYFKMQNVLVDDRRIWVDFSQSVAKMNISQVTKSGRGGGRGGRGGMGGGGGGGRGGYAGRDGLEARGRYRDEPPRTSAGGGGYGMVFEGMSERSGNGRKSRSRSPARRKERSRSRERHREKDRDRPREKERDRHREREDDRHRHRDDRGDRDRDRDRDRRR